MRKKRIHQWINITIVDDFIESRRGYLYDNYMTHTMSYTDHNPARGNFRL